MNRIIRIATLLVLQLVRVIGWIIIIFGALMIGFDTIPSLYMLIINHYPPGELLPDSRLGTQEENWRNLAIQVAIITFGFFVKDFSRILVRKLRVSSTPVDRH